MDIRKAFQYCRIGLVAGIPILHYNRKYFRKFRKHPEKYSKEYIYSVIRKIVLKVEKAFRVNLHIEGYENYQNLGQKALIIPNHLSDMDPLSMIAHSEKYITFAAKQEVKDFIVIGNVLSALNAVLLDRNNVMNQIADIKKMISIIKDPEAQDLVIFAEGTRNRQPETHCLDFHSGSIKIGYMAKAPIIPVSIYGTFRILDGKSYLKHYPVFIKYHDPIMYEDYKDIPVEELTEQIKTMINNQVDEFRKLDKEEIEKEKLSRKRKAKETACDNIA